MSLNHDVYFLRQVLRSVVWPLGAPDPRPGFRPYDLADHARKIFSVSWEQYQRLVVELQHTKPSNIVLSVQVLEARNLQTDAIKGNGRDPYCILGVVPAKVQRPSPHNSPNLRTKRKLSDLNEVKKTQIIKGSLHPKWNEQFELEVQDYLSEELRLIIWDNNGRTDQENNKATIDKGLGFKSLFKQFKHSMELGRGADDLIGQCMVPLKDIPAGGCDQWLDLCEDRKQKIKCKGQIRLRLQLSVKQDVDQLESVESDQCSMEDYYHIVQRIYSHALKMLELQGQEPLEQGLHPSVVQAEPVNTCTSPLVENSLQVAVHNPPLIHEACEQIPHRRGSDMVPALQKLPEREYVPHRRGSDLVPVLRKLPERSRNALQQFLLKRQQKTEPTDQPKQIQIIRHLPEQSRQTAQQSVQKRQDEEVPNIPKQLSVRRLAGRQMSAEVTSSSFPASPPSPLLLHHHVESAPELCSAESFEVLCEEVCEVPSPGIQLVCEQVVLSEDSSLTPLPDMQEQCLTPSVHHNQPFQFPQADTQRDLQKGQPVQKQAVDFHASHDSTVTAAVARHVRGQFATQCELEAWVDGPLVLAHLPEQSHILLQQFSVQNHFSSATQQHMELVVVLQVLAEHSGSSTVSETMLTSGIAALRTESALTQEDGNAEKQRLTTTELQLFDKYATAYIRQVVKGVQVTPRTIPPMFPATDTLRVEDFMPNIRIVCNLLQVEVWTRSELAKQIIASPITEMLQDDVKAWTQQKLASVYSNVKDSVVPETQMMTKLLQEAITKLYSLSAIAASFNQIGIDYYKVVSLTMEAKLAQKAHDLMQTMNAYQLRYHKYNANIRQSSMVSLEFYLVLRNFVDRVKANLSLRDLFKISLASYQSWFETSVIFWLQTFKDECRRRMEKALEIEKDIVQVTCLVKYSNSSVDVLSCFTKITSEWRQIGFADPDIALLGVTKITDTICDGAVQYAEKIEKILENNGYYDFIDNQLFDVTEQLCISLNNIVHVRCFLHQLPHLLDWAQVTHNMAARHESSTLAHRTLATLRKLTDTADADIMSRGRRLSARISDKMTVDLRSYVATLGRTSLDKMASLDPLLDYMDTNLGMFYERLESSMFPIMLEHIWDATLRVFSETLYVGKSPRYYKQMLQHLHSIEAYFNKENNSLGLTSNPLYQQLLDTLNLNCFTSDELMLEYYKSFTNSPQTPDEYYGHLGIKMGYVQETADNVTLYIKVLHASDLPKQYSSNDKFVSISLGPSTMFRLNRPSKTRVVQASSKPIFQEIFEFQMIPNDFLCQEGAVVVLSVWCHVRFFPHTFIGEVVVSIGDAMRISPPQNIEDMYAIMMPLKRPENPTQGPFQVLRDRVGQDKIASDLVRRRLAMTGSAVALCAPVCYLVTAVRGTLLSS